MARRGPYAKGIARREQILDAALSVIAERGFGRTSVADLAEASGLSQPGLLHHFGCKEELFTELVRRRDEVTATGLRPGEDLVGFFLRTVADNARVPGLVELYTRLSAEATDPDHAAHGFFTERYAEARGLLGGLLEDLREQGELPAYVDPAATAAALLALADGLQVQWLLDPDLDMAGVLDATWRAIRGPRSPSPDPTNSPCNAGSSSLE
ncbi:helix-turn-helix domain-containing protein [Nocardioides sp. AE5]|uniref:TetR/AcrR family transcriptional regulator n=1 Tax=Nocardioides sp. AE5 TaxID=2962573 RepID=UPI0028810A24|nr:helix-turn-helix domain-containing protein [Nocardioides sp. AE5]MDT0201930.1 helix-turn-helix domain-containing protein [Nocardioides sp. AE5]